MPANVPYHVGQQYAYALLGPVCLALADLQTRTQRYLDHLSFPPADREAVQAARDALAAAREELARLRRQATWPRA